MSQIEDVIIAPWVGSASCKKILTVAVLSTNMEIIDRISEALIEVHTKGNFRWKLKVLRSYGMEELVRQSNLSGRIGVDFVVFAIDTSRVVCLEWSRKVLAQVHPDLRIRRVVLVNASGLPMNALAVSADELISFQSELDIDILTANVYIPQEAAGLSKRLLKYLEVSVGIKTGIPNLNV